MSYSKSTTRPTVPTPATATEELHNKLVSDFTAHFSTIITSELLIFSRKACYASIINGVYAGNTLEATLGTVNAKIATEQVLQAISLNVLTVPVI